MVDTLTPIRSSLRKSEHPYLSGAWTPLLAEVDAGDLAVVEGRIPDDIDGVYLRNTENQVHEPLGRFHPFDGDGMIHAISFAGGRASYRNRFVRTRCFAAEQQANQSLWGGLMDPPGTSLRPGFTAHGGVKDASSTDVVVHGGKILSTFYLCGEAYTLDPETLEQGGIAHWVPIDGISAHPKVDEASGELLFFNYSTHAPYMHYGVVDRKGRLVHYVPVPLPGPRLPHDMAFSKNYVILNDFPMFWDPALLAKGLRVSRFDPTMKSRFGLLPRRGETREIRWFEADPTYVLHFLNAYEDGDEVVLDGYFQEEPMPGPLEDVPGGLGQMMAFLDEQSFKPKLHRWRFNLRTGETREHRLDERIVEFGMINQRYAGLPYRYAYSTTTLPGYFLFKSFIKHDLRTGDSWTVELPDGVFASEAPFAPRIDATDEDDGYLISFLIDENRQTSECILIDCKRFDEGPVARIALPHKISSGTHSCWADRRFIRDGWLGG